MTKRECVLVWAMGGAVAWAGIYLGFDFTRGTGGSAKARQQEAEIRMFAEAQRAKMVPLRLQTKEKRALDQASAAWANSPFIDRVTDTQPLTGRPEPLLYTGFVQLGAHQFAILNGREYQVSDPVGTGDFRVEDIQPDHVVLISKSGGRRMTIALQPFKRRKEKP